MSEVSSGNIVEYTITDADAQATAGLVAGEVYPLIVVSVNSEDGTYSGYVFTHTSITYVVVPPPAPAEPATPDAAVTAEETAFSQLSAADQDAFRAWQASQTPPAPPTLPGVDPSIPQSTGGNS